MRMSYLQITSLALSRDTGSSREESQRVCNPPSTVLRWEEMTLRLVKAMGQRSAIGAFQISLTASTRTRALRMTSAS